MTTSRRAFLAQIGCALAVAGVASTIPRAAFAEPSDFDTSDMKVKATVRWATGYVNPRFFDDIAVRRFQRLFGIKAELVGCYVMNDQRIPDDLHKMAMAILDKELPLPDSATATMLLEASGIVA